MAKFRYTAIDRQGKEIRGVEESGSIQEVLALLKDKSLYPVKVVPLASRSLSFSIPFLTSSRIKDQVFVVATRQLATLLNAGLPLVRALKILQEQQPAGPWKKTLTGLIEAMEAGSSFSDALSRYPRVFSKLYISTVRAGESGGVLDVVLVRLADYLEKKQLLRKKIISALVYPCVVLLVAVLILVGLMVFVIPKITALFTDMDIELPLVTQFLISISQAMLTKRFWFIVVGVIIGLKLLLQLIRSLETGRYIMDSLKLKMPVLGRLAQKVLVSRFSRTLGTLVSSGVPILEALNNVKETITNEVMSRGLEVVHDSVKEGESIVEPLRQCPVFDPVIINMVAVGEETGKLDEMLVRIADTYDSEVDIAISSVMALLEPILIFLVAGAVGFIVLAMFLPLVSLLTSLAG